MTGGTLTGLAGNPTSGGGTVTLNDSAAVVFAAAAAGTGVNARTVAALNLLAGGAATVATPARVGRPGRPRRRHATMAAAGLSRDAADAVIR